MNLVILTATVVPNATAQLSVSDSAVRMQQYQSAIEHWHRAVRDSSFRLAVVETSGADLDELLSEVPTSERADVQRSHYQPTDEEVVRGKGAMEMSAIGSVFAKGVDDEATVYKCTGRLQVANASQVVDGLPPEVIRARMMIDRSWMDCRLFGARAATWREFLLASGRNSDDGRGVYLEHAMAAAVAQAVALGGRRVERFRERVLFDGLSGSTGQRYTPRLDRVRARALGHLERVFAELAGHKQA